MGRPSLNVTAVHLNLPKDMIDRMDAIVGPKGRSKFARQAIGQLLDRLAPQAAQLTGSPFEHDGGHEPRLSAAGTAALIEVIRRSGFDQVQRTLGFVDPRDFLFALFGHTELPNHVVTFVAQLLVQHRLNR